MAVIVSLLVSSLVFFKLVPAEQALTFKDSLLQFLNILVQIASLLAAAYMTVQPLITYIKARLELKKQQLTQQSNLPIAK